MTLLTVRKSSVNFRNTFCLQLYGLDNGIYTLKMDLAIRPISFALTTIISKAIL